MASFKSNPVFYSLLIVIVAVVAGESWCIFERNNAVKKSQKLLVQKRAALIALQGVRPYPNEANKVAVEEDLLRMQNALAVMREELKGRGPTAEQLRNAKVPAEPTDVFFDIANFVENNRAKAKQAGVKIKADERFGFSSYASAGPERDLIAPVFLQRQIAQYLLDALFDAHPRELISLQRERPRTNAQLAAIAAGQVAPVIAGGSSAASADLFEIDPRLSARVRDFVNAMAFRVTFVGNTESLRILLNKLAAFELPLVVRSVEVEPAVVSATDGGPVAAESSNSLSAIFGTPTATSAIEAAKPKPLVAKMFSKFTVTIELIDLVSATSTAATPTP